MSTYLKSRRLRLLLSTSSICGGRYHELRKGFENGLYDRVTNLAEAYELASNFVFERRSVRGSVCLLPMVDRSKAAVVAGELVHAGGDHQQRDPAP